MKKHGEHAASSRTVTAVQNRWSLMNHDFNKFAGCLAHVKALPKSGYSEEVYKNDALATYRSDGGRPFRFLRAFECVRNNPTGFLDFDGRRGAHQEGILLCREGVHLFYGRDGKV